MRALKFIFATLVMLTSLTSNALNLEYPELQVVPSAEDRLAQASKERQDSGFFMRNWQLLTPATMLLVSSLYVNSDNTVDSLKYPNQDTLKEEEDKLKASTTLSTLVGLSWIGLTYYWDKSDVYGSSLTSIQKMPKSSRKQRLMRLRYAEEALKGRYDMMRKAKWLLGLSTVGLALSTSDQGTENSKAVASLAAITGLIPFLFKHSYETNYLNYQQYKNRIYGPVASAKFYMSSDNKVVPGVAMNLSF